ncbi:MAG: PIG-L family deacetylase [Candidatus Eisenbacteria bacterium]|uniref:PIG-L family deacetylase n=1 Tax=Eiseniibacteriota bacterium TaxID=2212470 RepID=A0A538TW36_UNCEI|nr:MAG: PIG-L family deacetylase [Candidatus Eisenbacteria bacterium]
MRDELLAPALPPASLDLVLVVGALERTPWHRWTLQLCHRALADDGRLVLVAPNFHGLASADALGFLAARLAREVALRWRRARRLPPPRERFGGRRYRRADLLATLDALGFRTRECTTRDAGWLAPLNAVRPGLVAAVSRSHLVLAERVPSLFGADPRRPYPDPARHRQEFERRHRAYFRDRERWLDRHPRMRPKAVETFDPACGSGRNVLVLCPHPDDELIGCGGTLARLIAHGASVTVVHATDGSEAASLWHAPRDIARTIRLEEARRVGERMGFADLIFWNEYNAAFVERPERVRELAQLLERLRPALIFTPFVTDIHPDHRVLSRMLARALGEGGVARAGSRVLSYQVWSSVPPNLACDITEMAGLQEEALFLYATAMKVDDYVHFCQDRNYHDAVAVAGRPGYFECFLATPAAEFPELAATVGGSDA